ncbi:FAD-dependent monooxygenase [Amycolatopsis sp. w19]|uniref:FAD-dependent monooxygenase n=1 Tax=Amycolatopsis sp. w19 TaxID=3448134 RepID=UPI003F1CC496
MSRNILISGAGIAGPALAYWLHRYGMSATVLERAPEPRLGGQTVDLRGAGRTVIERMGLEQAARDRVTREEGLRFVDEHDRIRASFGADGDGFVTDLELLRGELADLLHRHTRDDVDYVFGDEITGLTDTGDGVDVAFRHGEDRRFDLVVLADGLRSRTRDLVFADIARTRSFGLYTAYFTIPRGDSDERWARWYNAPGRRVVVLRPDNQGTTRAALSFLYPRPGLDRLRSPAQQDFLYRHYADAGWETPRVLDAMGDSPDFHFESVGQMRLEQWSRGRIALVGDAAYCASPLSGMGTSLALVGAYVLAGELGRHAGHHDAFRAYETIMRPYVIQAQKVSWFAPRLASPKTRIGIRLLTTLAGLATKPAIGRLTRRFTTPPADAIDLPAYHAQTPS